VLAVACCWISNCIHFTLNMASQQAAALQDIVSNAARAAEAAAEAARALRESQDRPRSSFSEASKVVKCPEFFGYLTEMTIRTIGVILHLPSKLGWCLLIRNLIVNLL